MHPGEEHSIEEFRRIASLAEDIRDEHGGYREFPYRREALLRAAAEEIRRIACSGNGLEIYEDDTPEDKNRGYRTEGW